LTEPTSLTIRPYARLLTMLGEQLIKNERIALIELIKNSYDADAAWVKISFLNFGDEYEVTPKSQILIEDSGCGMTEEIIVKHWLNPATPEKKLRKETTPRTKKGRTIQGEKGIGRYALLKLGRKIKIVTRSEVEQIEHIVEYDFSKYDDEFLSENGERKVLFLEDLEVTLLSRNPEIFLGKKMIVGTREIKSPPHGTLIEISNLKGSWSSKKVEDVYKDVIKLQSIFADKSQETTVALKKDFEVWIYQDHTLQKYQEQYIDKLNTLLENKSVFKIEDGFFDSDKQRFAYKINGIAKSLWLLDPEVTGIKVFKDRYGSAGKILGTRNLECGSFSFGFYIFDRSPKAPPKYQLDSEDKNITAAHRIYLYRDGIRVYPYGEPEDDWLRIDAYRGTIAAGHFLSNDQVVGYVNITQKGNPNLKDKTNREGLLDEGNATEDFITLIQVFLAYIRKGPYARYRKDLENKRDYDIFKTEEVKNEFGKLRDAFENDRRASELIDRAEKAYQAERSYLVRRVETTEELAGVGLSVETASHDIMGIMKNVLVNIDNLIQDLLSKDDINKDELLKELQSIRGGMSFIEAQLKDIQLLFTSSKQRRKNIRVRDVVEKVERIYRRLLKKEAIDLTIKTVGSPLMAKTTDAVLLQLLLNLFDNSVYWLQQLNVANKKIDILLDGRRGQMIFADNGPGVGKDDAPYIFEPFYSGKGEEGRGLGLYIARQLLERNDYSINLIESKREKILSGANFIINFVAEES
jgi:signal transduction histidine kinase